MVTGGGGGVRLPRRCLFSLDLKVLISCRSWGKWKLEGILAMRIRNEDAKRFVLVRGISTTYGCKSLRCNLAETSQKWEQSPMHDRTSAWYKVRSCSETGVKNRLTLLRMPSFLPAALL
ncbi:jg15489 [Pararge aegeria aegeria]|uniref:Jg15489 protein n=1 Tax=Pararge aegeria aegeria TaxID=348720 RepID=A0A8S4RBD7_9NEOP|nr:jg15489 [Pararge aegeria aegeria]